MLNKNKHCKTNKFSCLAQNLKKILNVTDANIQTSFGSNSLFGLNTQTSNTSQFQNLYSSQK